MQLLAQDVFVSLDARGWLIAGRWRSRVARRLWLLRRLSARVRDRIVGFLRNCRAGLAQLSGATPSVGVADRVVPRLPLALVHHLILYLGQHVALWDLLFAISATAIIAVYR